MDTGQAEIRVVLLCLGNWGKTEKKASAKPSAGNLNSPRAVNGWLNAVGLLVCPFWNKLMGAMEWNHACAILLLVLLASSSGVHSSSLIDPERPQIRRKGR